VGFLYTVPKLHISKSDVHTDDSDKSILHSGTLHNMDDKGFSSVTGTPRDVHNEKIFSEKRASTLASSTVLCSAPVKDLADTNPQGSVEDRRAGRLACENVVQGTPMCTPTTALLRTQPMILSRTAGSSASCAAPCRMSTATCSQRILDATLRLSSPQPLKSSRKKPAFAA
jgi:hypothetical protein